MTTAYVDGNDRNACLHEPVSAVLIQGLPFLSSAFQNVIYILLFTPNTFSRGILLKCLDTENKNDEREMFEWKWHLGDSTGTYKQGRRQHSHLVKLCIF